MSEENDLIITTSDEGEFDTLLNLLNPDRKIAEEMCADLRLIIRKFFSRKVYNRSDVEDLTQVAILRLANVVKRKNNAGEKIESLHGFAIEITRRIFFEYIKSKRNLEPLPPNLIPVLSAEDEDKEEKYIRYKICFDKCLDKFDLSDRKLFLDYYLNEGEEKNKEQRKKIARECGKSMSALKTYISRLRAKLKICCLNCIKQRPS